MALDAARLYFVATTNTRVVGVEAFGQHSHPNTLSSVRCRSSPTVQVVGKISSAFNCIYSLGIVLLSLLPLSQHLEEAVNLPAKVGFKHILARVSTLVLTLAVGLALPEFHKYASLIGASSMALNNFIFPPLFYYWIVKKATGVTLHRAQIGFFLFVLVVGVITGLAGTYAAIRNIVVNSRSPLC
ncbi:uncharacterized protein LOC135813681 isoform X2 [Sycon ciliatum]|uniref:uncharacterized protein LOC135813681 isoform X2 n=1 Tax=Sycon ciliatum TaxID=27933 RepID=UPI0031F60A98